MANRLHEAEHLLIANLTVMEINVALTPDSTEKSKVYNKLINKINKHFKRYNL